jgi:hypothetical protein
MARETWRLIQLGLGWFILLVIAPIGWVFPGPFGFLFIAIGSILILRSSQWSRRQFIKLAQRYPVVVGKLRRWLGRNGKARNSAASQAANQTADQQEG